jgi:uncharacterized protein with PQ loop repeat
MSVIGIILGIGISIGSIATYIPQFYIIMKNRSIEGISEASLIVMNIGMMCLSMNSLIYSWKYFFCNCLYDLLPFITIVISWIVVLFYYIIFLIYKLKDYSKLFSPTLSYAISYLFFVSLIIVLALTEKIKDHTNFLILYADILGIASSVANGLAYIPQIYILLKTRSNGNLSLLMYIFQTLGGVVILFFQIIIFRSPITTWITYVVVLAEQAVILILMCIFINNDKKTEIIYENVEDY